MKLGVAFSVFSGAEFLKPALLNVREFADHIVLVYSLQSNEGHPAPAWLLPLLRQMRAEGLADEVVKHDIQQWTRVPLEMQTIQRVKRQMGRIACVNAGCDYYMTRDCDEFYDKEQFRQALKVAEQYDLLICGLYDYIKTPLARSRIISPLHVPVLHKSWLNMLPKDFGILVDHERTCNAESFHVLSHSELMMHHMSTVRFNSAELARKFQGHSHFTLLGEPAIQEYRDMIDHFDPSQMETVPDQFGILKYWQEEFGDLYASLS